MSVGRICVRSVYSATPEESVRLAARRMGEADVGVLVVVDEKGYPVGVVTDRDVALRCVGGDSDPDTTPVSSIMTSPATIIWSAWRRDATPLSAKNLFRRTSSPELSATFGLAVRFFAISNSSRELYEP